MWTSCILKTCRDWRVSGPCESSIPSDEVPQDFKALHGVRPTAVEAYQDGYNPRAVRERAGSWSRFVATQGDLDEGQQRALETHGAFIDALDTTEMVKSYFSTRTTS